MDMKNLILASQSQSRKYLLKSAGLNFASYPAHVAEHIIKQELKKDGATSRDLALHLSHSKALKISEKFSESYVIGCDQTLDCKGIWLDKPTSIEDARNHLVLLRNSTHTLHSAVCVAKGKKILWNTVMDATMITRNYSDDFIDFYLTHMGDEVLDTVGAYKLETIGSQLFLDIQGDYFTVLGLPLLPLLAFLREQDIIPL